ncbi:hypothetical protein L9F63_010465, partial [Diploptera punctata]
GGGGYSVGGLCFFGVSEMNNDIPDTVKLSVLAKLIGEKNTYRSSLRQKNDQITVLKSCFSTMKSQDLSMFRIKFLQGLEIVLFQCIKVHFSRSENMHFKHCCYRSLSCLFHGSIRMSNFSIPLHTYLVRALEGTNKETCFKNECKTISTYFTNTQLRERKNIHTP